MDPVKYKPLVVCIELNPFKHESGSVRVNTPLAAENKAR